MKYLIIQKSKWSAGYSIEEFASAEELTAHLLDSDAITRDVIIAKRLGVSLTLGEYVAPATEAEAIAEQEAA